MVLASDSFTYCLHACYTVGMKAVQYTIRNVPKDVDQYLRRLAGLRDESLNSVIIQELSERVGGDTARTSLAESLDWFIGSGIDSATMRALEEEDSAQKELARRELNKPLKW